MKRLVYILPLVVFAVLVGYFALGLTKDSRILPSVLIDTQVAEFDLPPIKGSVRGLADTDLGGEVALVNIFGSWCDACRVEHPFLMKLKDEGTVALHGIDWTEQNRDDGPAWLARFGNPYGRIGDDPQSVGAIAFGVTGAPETFVVDKNGVIRFKRIGPMDQTVWDQQIAPIIERLRRE